MTRTKRWCLIGCLFLVAAAGLFWAILSRNQRDGADLAVNAPGEKSSPSGVDERYIMVGGIRRRASDVEPIQKPSGDESSEAVREALDYGRTKPIDADANAHTKSVAEALQDGSHPERLSVLMRPGKFDLKAFKANPKAYLDVVEPGRAFESAEPGQDVPRLAAITPRRVVVVQGDEVALQVAAQPGAPVSFTSFDLGTFQNGLTSVSVQANDEGMAEATFTGGPGTIADVHVQAASPVSSGQVRFTIHVTKPDALAEN